MIPKIIHYVWLGEKELSPLAKKCISSWKKYLPEYKIMRWDESTFDINSIQYVKEAYEAKKFAFASDYIRLYALWQYGGIYMDTDVEVLKPLDQFLHHDFFSGFEDIKNVPTGIMGAFQFNPWIKQQLNEYNNRHFIRTDGSFDFTTNVEVITKDAIQNGLIQDNTYQELKNKCTFYPKEYFCPKNYVNGKIELTKNSYTIHHFAGSWVEISPFEKKKRQLFKYVGKFLGRKIIALYSKICLFKFYRNTLNNQGYNFHKIDPQKFNIGIITYARCFNFGTQLQLFALYTVLKEKHEVTIIDHTFTASLNYDFTIDSYHDNFLKKWIKNITYFLKWFRHIDSYTQNLKNAIPFIEFQEKYLNLPKHPISTSKMLNQIKKMNCVVFGSDNIWIDFDRNWTPFYFGHDVPEKIKKIAYAPSFSRVNHTDLEIENIIKKYLLSFSAISIREKETVEKISKIYPELDIQTNLDPTLLIPTNIWENMAEKGRLNEEPFILYYRISEDKELDKYIQELALKENIKIINIYLNEALGPLQFLWLIKNAKLIITNSFHATVFSIIFKKLFWTILPSSGPQRIKNILKQLSLENRLITNISEIPFDLYESKIDYTSTLAIIEDLANSSKEWLFKKIQELI